jgi:hypothetical protein
MRRRGLAIGLWLAFAPAACTDDGASGTTPDTSYEGLGQSGFSITEYCPPTLFQDMGLPDGSPDMAAPGCTLTCQNTGSTDQCGTTTPPAPLPPEQGGCWITGGGFIVDADGNDSFGGNGMPMKDGTIRGEWEHVDHGTNDKLHGQVRYLVCRHVPEPGPGNPSGPSHNFDINQAYYGGPARWFTPAAGWQDGYWFDVMAEDHGEPGNKPGPGNHGSMGPDYYHFTARKMTGASQSGEVVYDTAGDFQGGNFQIHPPNGGHPFTTGTLPSWVMYQP